MTGPRTDLALGGRGLAEAAEPHPAQDAVRLGELNLVVLTTSTRLPHESRKTRPRPRTISAPTASSPARTASRSSRRARSGGPRRAADAAARRRRGTGRRGQRTPSSADAAAQLELDEPAVRPDLLAIARQVRQREGRLARAAACTGNSEWHPLTGRIRPHRGSRPSTRPEQRRVVSPVRVRVSPSQRPWKSRPFPWMRRDGAKGEERCSAAVPF